MQFCTDRPHLTVANVNELNSMICTRAVFISATKCNKFICLQLKCMTKYYISVSSLISWLILLCLQCLCPYVTGHLFHKFTITESDWYRIKQSIDSKCRTAWRRKQRGQSLAVKSFSRRNPASQSSSGTNPCVLSRQIFLLRNPVSLWFWC